MKPSLRHPTSLQENAVRAFALRKGRMWRKHLRGLWYSTARPADTESQILISTKVFGEEWLEHYTPDITPLQGKRDFLPDHLVSALLGMLEAHERVVIVLLRSSEPTDLYEAMNAWRRLQSTLADAHRLVDGLQLSCSEENQRRLASWQKMVDDLYAEIQEKMQ